MRQCAKIHFLAVTKSQSYERCVTSDVCRPLVPNVIRRLGEFKFTVTCFISTSSQPMSEFHSYFVVFYGPKWYQKNISLNSKSEITTLRGAYRPIPISEFSGVFVCAYMRMCVRKLVVVELTMKVKSKVFILDKKDNSQNMFCIW